MSHFKATWRGRSVFDIQLKSAGIKYAAPLEWVLAARWSGYRFYDFLALPGDQQSFLVAAYRTANQIDGVIEKARADEIKRKTTTSKKS